MAENGKEEEPAAAAPEKIAAKSTPAKTDDTDSSPKKPKKRSAPANHPPCIDMVTEAISVQGESDGTSFQSIKKYIDANFDFDIESKGQMAHIKKALKGAIANGKLIQTKGKGASGSFKMGEDTSVLMSKPTKRQLASAEAAVQNEAKDKRFAKAAKQKKSKKKRVHHIAVQKASTASRKPVKKPAAKKSPAKQSPAKKSSKKKTKAKAKPAPPKKAVTAGSRRSSRR